METVQNLRSSSSNPVSCSETSIKIYGSKEEIRARKSPETVDAPGFAPDASIPVILYGADDQIRTDYLVLTKDVLYQLSHVGTPGAKNKRQRSIRNCDIFRKGKLRSARGKAAHLRCYPAFRNKNAPVCALFLVR